MSELLEHWLLERGEDPIWAVFDHQSISRGLTYADEGRVLDIIPTENGFHARVRGSGRQVYRTHVRAQPLDAQRAVVVHCSCPVGRNCKHGVAALAHYIDRFEPSESTGVGSMTWQWLSELEHAVGEQSSAQATREQLVYIVTTDDRGLLWVGASKTRLRKDGGYGKLVRYSGNGRTGARFLTPADERVLRLLPSSPAPVERVTVPTVLRELAALDRAHWGSAEGPVIGLGPARHGAFHWLMDDDGGQRLRCRIDDNGDPAQVIMALPPWYVEPATARVGPLETGLSDRVAIALLHAPVVAAHEVADVIEPLQALGAGVPLPERPEERALTGVTPVPHLRLQTRLLWPAHVAQYAGPEDREPVAALAFDYDGIEIEATRSGEGVLRHHDGELWRVDRDLDAERQAVERVAGLGLRPRELADDIVLIPEEPEDWVAVVTRDVPRLRAEGWRVSISEDFPYRLVAADDWYADLEASEGGAWFDLELGVEVEGERHSLLPLLIELIRSAPEAMSQSYLEAIEPGSSLLLDLGDGRLLPVPAERAVPILRTLTELYDPKLDADDGRLTLPAVRAEALDALEADGAALRWQGEQGLRELGRRIAALGRVTPAAPPAGLHGALRGYQREGVGWLQALGAQGLGGVLADDMGLGKTIQMLAHLLLEREHGRGQAPSLVVAPTSLLFNWEREAERFAPGLRVLRLHGPERHAEFPRLGDYDLVLTTYALVTRDIETLAQREFHLVVLDEAQAVKNPRAKAAQAVRRLRAQQRVCLTGTPLENHLGELWSQFDFLLPGLLGDRQGFNRLFRRPIEKSADEERQTALQRRIRPFLLRRTKEAIAPELPAKTEVQRHAELTGAQRDLYETVRVAMHERVRREVAQRGLARSQVVVLDALLKLRQVCCDPRLVRMEAAREVRRSAKLELLMNLLGELHAEGRRVLLFSQFTSMLGLIEEALAPTGIDYVKLTGRTRHREQRVQRFQSGEVPLFLISLKAGGTGLNLTAADTVIHYDPWWNPAVMQQATDRAHRIGQSQPVFAYHLLTHDTVEEKITALQQRKAELGDALLGGSTGSTAALEMADVDALFEPLA